MEYIVLQASETGRPPSQTSFHYVRGALHFLLPLLLRILAKQVIKMSMLLLLLRLYLFYFLLLHLQVFILFFPVYIHSMYCAEYITMFLSTF